MGKRVSSQMARHVGVALQPIEEVLAMLSYRSEHRENHLVQRASDLNITWHDQGPSKTEAGYYANIEGRDLLLTPNALKLATKMVKSTPDTWDQAMDRNAFPKFFNHVLDNRPSFDGLLVRTDGLTVNAVLPSSYKVKDAAELLGDLIEPLQENVGEIHGVSMIDENNGDVTSLRIVVGENIVPSLKPEFGQLMMFLLNTSETGAIDTQTTMGFWRTSCDNSAIREQQLQRWDHKSDWDKFWDGTMTTVRQFSYFQPQMGQIFEALFQSKLDIPASDLLRGFRNEKLITNAHHDAAEIWINQPTEDGRTVENQYDLFNVLTKAAQDLPTIAAQHKAEQSATKIFTQPGGIFERLRDASRRRANRGETSADELPN